MQRKFILTVSLVAVLLSSCVTTQSIQQGKDLSSSGIAYTNAVENLLVITTDKVIDFDSAELIKSRRGGNPREKVIEKNKYLIDVIKEINRFRTQTKLLKTYFINLQALADSPFKNDAGGAVRSLSESISDLNQKRGKNGLTESQNAQIGALAGIVANTIHAAKIKNALKRDAEIISVYLALQEKQLMNITDILKDRFKADHGLFVNKEVIVPYADISKVLPFDWSEKRKKWIKSKSVNEYLEAANKAAKHLSGIWFDILQGKSDANSISVLISDLNEFITTIQALENANKASNDSN